MSRSLARLAASLAVAVTLAAVTAATAAAQDPAEPKGEPSELGVLDLTLTVVSLDGSLTTAESEKEVKLTLAADVLFAFDKASLEPAARSRLDEVTARIRKDAPGQIRVEGYTDSKGTDAYNLDLSRRRADTVVSALHRALGGDAPSFKATGRGEADPVAANTKPDGSDNPKGRAKNRRVTISYGR
jgi:outer membrane protein OmpA-like peptidoglycan-associated protein